MSSYLFGYLIGRLLFVTILTWLVIWLSSRLDFKTSLQRLRSAWSVGTIFLMYFLLLTSHTKFPTQY